MTTDQDRPTQFDMKHPLLGLDDPRLGPPAYDPADNMGDPVLEDERDFDREPQIGDIGATRTACPLCGTAVDVTFVVTGKEPCNEHPGEMHHQVEIDTAPMEAHAQECKIYDLLDEIFPDVRQDDDTPDQNPS